MAWQINIDFTKWLALIKLFELGTSARRAGIEIGTGYPTVLLAFVHWSKLGGFSTSGQFG